MIGGIAIAAGAPIAGGALGYGIFRLIHKITRRY